MRHALACLLLIASGCSVSTGAQPEGYRCNDGICPDGQICNLARVCEFPRDAGSDAPDATPGLRTCGGSEGLVDDFADGFADWWLDPGSGSLDVLGQLRLELPTSMQGEAAAAFSAPRLDLIDSHWFARVIPSDGSASTTFGVQAGSGNYLHITHVGGVLEFDRNGEVLDGIPYAAADHVFWGFRERDGTVSFETSADGVTFTGHVEVATEDYTDRFQAIMSTGRGGAGQGATAVFDDLNGGGQTSYQFCKAEERSDDFDDGEVSEVWSQFPPGNCVTTEEDGQLTVAAPMGGCTLVTTGLHDLSESQFELEHVEIVGTPFLSYGVSGEYGRFQLDMINGNLSVLDCLRDEPCVSVAQKPFAGELVWRFRGDADEIVFEVSLDGADFDELARSSALNPRALRAFFSTQAGQSARLERFN